MLFAAQKAPRVTEDERRWLLWRLNQAGWIGSKRLITTSMSDRRLRAIAAASKGQIISGQRGYARTDQASVEDVNHCIAWLKSQAAAMDKRTKEISAVLNGRLQRSA